MQAEGKELMCFQNKYFRCSKNKDWKTLKSQSQIYSTPKIKNEELQKIRNPKLEIFYQENKD